MNSSSPRDRRLAEGIPREVFLSHERPAEGIPTEVYLREYLSLQRGLHDLPILGPVGKPEAVKYL